MQLRLSISTAYSCMQRGHHHRINTYNNTNTDRIHFRTRWQVSAFIQPTTSSLLLPAVSFTSRSSPLRLLSQQGIRHMSIACNCCLTSLFVTPYRHLDQHHTRLRTFRPHFPASILLTNTKVSSAKGRCDPSSITDTREIFQ